MQEMEDIELQRYVVTFTCVDRADSSNVSSWNEYYESENKTNILKHILTQVKPPEWHDDLDPEDDLINPQLEHLDNMTTEQVQIFFDKCYGEYQSPDDDYHDKWFVIVKKYQPPSFVRVLV